MNSMNFSDVAKRLMQVLEISTETKLAAACGLNQGAWARRKMRASVPIEAIDRLIEENELNPEFVYQGTGNVFRSLEGATWGELFAERAKQLERLKKYLTPMGHDNAVKRLKKLNPDDAALLHLLRDLDQGNMLDIRWLITDKLRQQDDYTNEEKEVIAAYRNAPNTGKAFIRQAAGLVTTKTMTKPDRASKSSTPKPTRSAKNNQTATTQIVGQKIVSGDNNKVSIK